LFAVNASSTIVPAGPHFTHNRGRAAVARSGLRVVGPLLILAGFVVRALVECSVLSAECRVTVPSAGCEGKYYLLRGSDHLKTIKHISSILFDVTDWVSYDPYVRVINTFNANGS